MTFQKFKEEVLSTEAGQKYFDLIQNAQREGYVTDNHQIEIHHIVPKSLRGSNNPENLVALTVYDHIKAHYWLAKALGSSKPSTLKAFECMCKMHFSKISELEQVTLEQLEDWGHLRDISKYHSLETRKKISKATTGKRKVRQKPVSPETRKRISQSRQGIVFSEEHRKHISEAKRGKTYRRGYKHSDETKKRMSLAKQGKVGNFVGHKHSDESKEKMRKAHAGKKLTDLDKQHKSEAQKKRWENYRNSKKVLN